MRLALVLAVAVGGALGSVARYELSRAVHARAVTAFPLGTLTVNLLGCLAIGFCYIWFENRGGPMLRDFVRIGILGGFTTFSSYSIESVSLLEKGHYGLATLNILGSVAGGLIAALLGVAVGRWVFGGAHGA